jgi:hypothetical protein
MLYNKINFNIIHIIKGIRKHVKKMLILICFPNKFTVMLMKRNLKSGVQQFHQC